MRALSYASLFAALACACSPPVTPADASLDAHSADIANADTRIDAPPSDTSLDANNDAASDAPITDATTDVAPDASTDCVLTTLPAPHRYVSPAGDDTADGSFAHPWATISHASANVSAGDTVHVLPGTYAERVDTQANGTATSRIRFVSECRWQARLAPTGGSAIWSLGQNSGAASTHGNYVDIIGFDIDGSNGSMALGIINYASNSRVLGNHVHDIPAPMGCTDGNGGAGIDDANYGAQDDDIIGNVVHDIGGSSIGTCVHAVIHGVYHANLRGHVQNNIVYHVAAYGIHTWHAAREVVITNNTVFANGWFNGAGTIGGGIIVGDGDSPGGVTNDGTTVSNNIVFANPGEGIREYGDVGMNNRYTNNLIAMNGYDTLFVYGTATNTITGDPMFVDYRAMGGGDYHLAAGSPAIDRGTTACAPGTSSCVPDTDLEGGSRPRGAAIDVGAYESGGAGTAAWPWY